MCSIIGKLVVRLEFPAFSYRPIESIQVYSLLFNKHPYFRSDDSDNSVRFTNQRLFFDATNGKTLALCHLVSSKSCSLKNKPAKSISDRAKEISLTFAKCPLLFYRGTAFMQASNAKESCSAQAGLREKQ